MVASGQLRSATCRRSSSTRSSSRSRSRSSRHGRRGAVGHRLGRAGVRAARRRRAGARRRRCARPPVRRRRAGSSSRTCVLVHARPPADQRPVVRGGARSDGRDRRPDRRRQDDAREPHHAVLRARRRAHPARRPRHRRCHADDVRARTGMVLQDPWLFAGTIRENIRYGRGRHRRGDPRAAAGPRTSTASCTRCPTATTPCSTRRRERLSAGEKQLITIARAFVAQPSVLILDEATSSVDTRTELLLQHAMAALREGRTSS